MKPASPYLEEPLRAFSGVVIRTKTDVELLAETIELSAREGNLAFWCVVELLYQLQPHHWDAYARLAGVPSPSPATIALTIDAYKRRIGYIEPAPQPNPNDQFS